MKCSHPILFFPIFFFSICLAQEVWFDTEMPAMIADNSWFSGTDSSPNNPNSYTFFQSPNGNACVTASIKENNSFARIQPRQTTFASQNYHVIKRYSSNDWNNYLAGRRENISPSNWLEESRVELFAEFELWEHEGYRNLLKSFPEYEQMIVKIDELSKTDIEVQNALNNCFFERGWFSDTKLKEFIKQELPEAKRIVRQKEADKKKQRQIEEEQERKRERNRLVQLEQEKRNKKAEKVQKVFLEQEEKIENIADDIYEKSERSFYADNEIENLFLTRNQQRVEAFHTALDNRFQIEHKTYDISDRANTLLKRQNVDTKQFEQCTGNAIQQQFHTEFVEVLNKSADLTDLNFGIDKDLWFFTIGDLSSIGSICNNAGQVSLTQDFSDICWEVYTTGKFASAMYKIGKEELGKYLWMSSCTVAKEIYNDPKGCAIAAKKKVTDFCSNVLHKAVVRPLKNLDAFIKANEKDPSLVPRLVGKSLQNLMIFAAKQNMLEQACRNNSQSPEAQKLFDEFQAEYLQPLHQKISSVTEAFNEVPTQEKAEELAAFLVQMGIIKGIGKVLKAAAISVEGLEIGGIPPIVEEILIDAGMPGVRAIPVCVPATSGVVVDIVTGIADTAEAGLWTALGVSKTVFFMGDTVEKTVGTECPVWDMPIDGKTINGRYYTRHALERMAPDTEWVRKELAERASDMGLKNEKLKKYIQPRGIPPMVVEDVIQSSQAVPTRSPWTWSHTKDRLKVIANEFGNVISVHKIKKVKK